MQIGYDKDGTVWMTGDAVPKQFNGIELTVVDLSEDQMATLESLPAQRGGTTFDGKNFGFIQAAAQEPVKIDISAAALARAMIAKGIITQADLDAATAAMVKA